ncbi:hypothetical protein D1007_48699 [Hordeum vulgare]|nr:hypothetical protein D1007_48699 [Hordeum vulgare]
MNGAEEAPVGRHSTRRSTAEAETGKRPKRAVALPGTHLLMNTRKRLQQRHARKRIHFSPHPIVLHHGGKTGVARKGSPSPDLGYHRPYLWSGWYIIPSPLQLRPPEQHTEKRNHQQSSDAGGTIGLIYGAAGT